MSIELHVMGVACNLFCAYCYQHPIRDAGNWAPDHDMAAMKQALIKENGVFTIFGGEGLLTPKPVLEELWAFGLERWGRNSLQTNGVLIDEDLIALFRKYKVGVGFSLDGPEEMNDSRWAGSLEKTRVATAKSQANLERLCREGTYTYNDGTQAAPSLIITMHRGNASPVKRPQFKRWLRDLEACGLRHARLHPLEIEHEAVRTAFALTVEETLDFFLDMYAFEKTLKHLRFDVFKDLRNLQRGDDTNVTCIWNSCDPWTTEAVRGVDAQGGLSNCQRTNKEGIDLKKAETVHHERQLGLAAVPMEQGGCGGCRFWSMCKGNCPGTADQQDWRNRTDECAVWYDLFEVIEHEMESYGLTPLSKDSRRPELEERMLQVYATGKRPSIHTLLQQMQEGAGCRSERVVRDTTHGDHTDQTARAHRPTHGDSDPQEEHGDHTDHGDSDQSQRDHGDHTDAQRPMHEDDSTVTHGDSVHGDQSTVTSFHGDSD